MRLLAVELTFWKQDNPLSKCGFKRKKRNWSFSSWCKAWRGSSPPLDRMAAWSKTLPAISHVSQLRGRSLVRSWPAKADPDRILSYPLRRRSLRSSTTYRLEIRNSWMFKSSLRVRRPSIREKESRKRCLKTWTGSICPLNHSIPTSPSLITSISTFKKWKLRSLKASTSRWRVPKRRRRLLVSRETNGPWSKWGSGIRRRPTNQIGTWPETKPRTAMAFTRCQSV